MGQEGKSQALPAACSESAEIVGQHLLAAVGNAAAYGPWPSCHVLCFVARDAWCAAIQLCMVVALVTTQRLKSLHDSGIGSPELGRLLDKSPAARAGEACHALFHVDFRNLWELCDVHPFLQLPQV